MTVVRYSGDPLLDMPPWRGQRSCTFKFTVYNFVTGRELGEVHPLRESTPKLSHDTSRTIMRQITELFFDRDDTAMLDTIQHRLRVEMVFPNGQTYPLGTYMAVDQSRIQTTWGLESNATFTDSMFIVDQEIETAYSAGVFDDDGNIVAFRPCDQAINDLLTGVPVRYEAQSTPFYTIGAWSEGTNRGSIINEIAVDGDYFAPWFDFTDTMQFIRAFDPAGVQVPDFDFDTGYRINQNSVILTDNLLTAPNRFKVVSNGSASDLLLPVFGVYDVPSSAPHSIQNRGFVIPRVTDWQVDNSLQATAIATNLGLRETIFETVEFSTLPDPRHDSYNVFVFNGENWLEIAWEMDLSEGGEMRHTGRKSYR